MPLRAPKGFIDESDPKVCQIGHPAPPWLVNYADLMTELVCFFVILYALSAALDKNMQAAKSDIEETMKKQNVPGQVEMTKEGLKVTLEEKGGVSYFESGFADVTPTMKELLEKVSPTLRSLAAANHRIIVEGHTDDVPIHNDYFWSNWELSTARATAVVEQLVGEKGLPAPCMAAAGYGEFQPVCRETTAECRARNRRVVFMIKNTDTERPCTGRAVEPAAGAGGAVAPEGSSAAAAPHPRALHAAPAPADGTGRVAGEGE